jgi:hypothetical protein
MQLRIKLAAHENRDLALAQSVGHLWTGHKDLYVIVMKRRTPPLTPDPRTKRGRDIIQGRIPPSEENQEKH